MKNPDPDLGYSVSTDERLAAEAEKTFLLENALDAVIGVDQINQVIFWNKNAERIFGWSKDEIIGRDMTDMIIPHQLREGHRRGLQRFVESGIPRIQNRRIEIAGLRKSGEIFTMELTVSSVKTENGYRFYSFMRDLTELKRVENQLRQNEEEFRTLANSIPQLTWMAEPDGNIFWYNDRWYEYTGTKVGDMDNFGWTKVHHPDVLPGVFQLWTVSLKTGQPFEMTFPLKSKTGEYRSFLTRVIPLRDGNGNIIRWFGTNTDVENETRAVRDLAAAKQEADIARAEAERANHLKSAFLANMSHEIRTPLGAMMGFADLLRDRNLSDTEHSEYTDILVRNGEQLSVIINDILDLSKVEAGHLTLEHKSTSPRDLANEIVSLLVVKAHEKGLQLEVESAASAPTALISDPTRIRQVLLNLVSNSIKFTKSGLVKIKVHGVVDEASPDKRGVGFEVIDTGIGIPESQKEKVFDVFVQADGSITRRFGGTGLGLALSRRLARALGGDVVLLESEENKGSRFLFKVFNAEKPPEDHEEMHAELNKIELTRTTFVGKRILAVDDSPENRQLVSSFLAKYGARVETAENGLIGYHMALMGNYDAVLMDIQMPEMDGYTATRKLRANGFTKPVIAITAHAMDEVRKRCMDVGCTDHLSKPLNPQKLAATVARHLFGSSNTPKI